MGAEGVCISLKEWMEAKRSASSAQRRRHVVVGKEGTEEKLAGKAAKILGGKRMALDRSRSVYEENATPTTNEQHYRERMEGQAR